MARKKKDTVINPELNARQDGITIQKVDFRHYIFESIRKGWEEARKGIAFDYDYVSRNDFFKGNAYEDARLAVLALREAGLKVPVWDSPYKRPAEIARMTKLCNNQEWDKKDKDNTPLSIPFGEKYWMAPNPDWIVSRDTQINVY